MSASQTRIAVQDGRTMVAVDPCPHAAPEQHEAPRLFEPAPEQIPGQLHMARDAHDGELT